MRFFGIFNVTILLGGVFGGFVKLIYKLFGINIDDTFGAWMVGVSILILLFIIYKNIFKFSLTEKATSGLSKEVTYILSTLAVLMLVCAPFIK
ncbi:hypothetical protein [Bacillus kwashiorkori]|uniref:hypothetical protein n=1 Tax=Bacillus kwashiorkori TaxID=1522318 RepID=UPI00131A3A67|nr:hypothetical protein [Bacillus kwashiorkori]